MTIDELIDQLTNVLLDLGKPEVDDLLRGKPAEQVGRFTHDKLELAAYRIRLQAKVMAAVLLQLQNLAPQIQAGIDDLKAATDRMDDLIAITDTLATVVGLVARLLAVIV